eukprot:c18565_g1_i1 orf=562-909(+)
MPVFFTCRASLRDELCVGNQDSQQKKEESFDGSETGGLRRGAEEASLVTFKFGKLGFAVHFYDEGDDEDKEGSACDPSGFACAPQKLLAEAGGVGGSALALVEHLRLSYSVAHPR